MKNQIFINSIIIFNLITQTYCQNCPFAQRALQSSQRGDASRSLYLDELKTKEYDFYVDEGQPGHDLWTESNVEQSDWDNFRRARILLNTAEIVNHKIVFDKQCHDLSLYTKCFTSQDICYSAEELQCDANITYRTMGGTCNNLKNPRLGAKYSAYGRLIPAHYHDCLHSERRTAIDNIELPYPRGIGNILSESTFWERTTPSSQSILNVLTLFYGQIVSHDTGSRIAVQRNYAFGAGIQCCSQNYSRRLSEEVAYPACKPMDVPVNDPFYSQFEANCMNFISSQITFSNECKIGSAEKSNTVTAFMDLSIIYGEDEVTQNQLRTRQLGRMKTNSGNVLPEIPNCERQPCYFLGDSRLVQTPMLAQLHSLFLRLHNLISPKISSDDEIAYQEGKRLTIALYQRIIYNEWIPLFLEKSASYQLSCDPNQTDCGKYNPDIDPSTTNDFSHGAFRWLHAFVPSTINLYGADQKLIMSRDLSDMDSSRVNILEQNYDNLLRGQIFDSLSYGGYSQELRNRLMKDARGMGIDLFSIDIKRSRDHGVPAYHAYIPFCSNTTAQIDTWSDLDPYFSSDSIKILKVIYKSPRDIDLLVGVFGEKRTGQNAILGKIGSCIIAEQFKRLKYGDRFFYQFTDGPYSFTEPQLREIELFSMAKFLCAVTSIGSVPKNAFLTPSITNPMVNCTDFKEFDFSMFSKF